VADETTKPTIVIIRRARRKVTSVFSLMVAPNQIIEAAENLPFDQTWA
jgi:hypothetical protein